MRIDDGDSFSHTTMMHPDITLSIVIDGKVVRTPVKFTFAELEQRMVVDFQCAADRISAIFRQVEEHGSCRLTGRSAEEVYLIEKILAS